MPVLRCSAVLFDLDGVLVDSRDCIELIWRTWAAQRGLDYEPFLRVAHGRRTSETLRLVAPELDPAAEVAKLDAMEEMETRGLRAMAGAIELLRLLPETRRAVVTSGSRAVATLRLTSTHLPIPQVFVTAEDVARGKPDPEGYLAAARRLAVPPDQCTVVEDSPPGVAAGKAAGMQVIALATTHALAALGDADIRLPALSGLRVGAIDGAGLTLEY